MKRLELTLDELPVIELALVNLIDDLQDRDSEFVKSLMVAGQFARTHDIAVAVDKKLNAWLNYVLEQDE